MNFALPAILTKDPRTTLAGAIGAVAILGGHFGLHLSTQDQIAILTLALLALACVSRDSNKKP